jgi:hypothetical protein
MSDPKGCEKWLWLWLMDLKKDTNVSVNILNYKKVETYSERGAKIYLLKK